MKIKSAIICVALIITTQAFAQDKNAFIDSISTNFVYTADVLANTMGGIETGVRYLDNIDIQIGGRSNNFDFFIYGLGNQGGSITELVGDVEYVSNIETNNSWQIHEAWVNVHVKPLKGSLLVGLYDLNTEFDFINTSQLFMNSSHGIGPEFSNSGVSGPSIFPVTSLAVRLKTNIIPGFSFKAVVLDAVPSEPYIKGEIIKLSEDEGALFAMEIEYSKQDDTAFKRDVNQNATFRVAAGYWEYSEERFGWNGELASDFGVYTFAEARLYSEKGDQGLWGYVRYGVANDEISRFVAYGGLGFVYTGILPNRDNDKLGLAFSLPVNGDPFIISEGILYDDELTTELTYLWQLTDSFSLQFDTQYIISPNQIPDLENALVVGFRTSISL